MELSACLRWQEEERRKRVDEAEWSPVMRNRNTRLGEGLGEQTPVPPETVIPFSAPPFSLPHSLSSSSSASPFSLETNPVPCLLLFFHLPCGLPPSPLPFPTPLEPTCLEEILKIKLSRSPGGTWLPAGAWTVAEVKCAGFCVGQNRACIPAYRQHAAG